MDDRTSRARRRRLGAAPDGPGLTCVEIGRSGAGPCLVILGGVHGDEPQGVRAASWLVERLARHRVTGFIRIVPICHEAAFEAGTRAGPHDGADLARTFPGTVGGTPTEQLAALLDREVIADADVLIDLHSAGLHYAMPLLAGYCDDRSPASQTAGRLAAAAGLPVIWRHPGPPAAGRTGTAPHRRGVPFVYLESTDERDSTVAYVDAVERIAVKTGSIAPAAIDVATSMPPRRLFGSGDLDAGGILAPATGLIELRVDRLAAVAAGDVVATLIDPRDGERTELAAPTAGVVAMVRRSGWVASGALVAFLTGVDDHPDD